MNAPFQGFPPQLLAQIAQGAFRPPQAMGGSQLPGVPGMQMPTGGGMGLGEGMAGLAQGLAGWKPDIFMAKGRTAGDADLGGYGASPVDPMGGNPNAQPVEVFNPTGASSGGFGSWLRGLF